jgi:predicted neutral ceramidase superfamily lipid hydrolase
VQFYRIHSRAVLQKSFQYSSTGFLSEQFNRIHFRAVQQDPFQQSFKGTISLQFYKIRFSAFLQDPFKDSCRGSFQYNNQTYTYALTSMMFATFYLPVVYLTFYRPRRSHSRFALSKNIALRLQPACCLSCSITRYLATSSPLLTDVLLICY